MLVALWSYSHILSKTKKKLKSVCQYPYSDNVPTCQWIAGRIKNTKSKYGCWEYHLVSACDDAVVLELLQAGHCIIVW